MDAASAITSSLVNAVGESRIGSVQGAAATQMLKESLDGQASAAAELLASVEQPTTLATSGTLGTQLNVYA